VAHAPGRPGALSGNLLKGRKAIRQEGRKGRQEVRKTGREGRKVGRAGRKSNKEW
jgi:hypothetical protein